MTQSPSRQPTINFPLQPSSARSSVPSTPVLPLSDLELRIDTSRTLDLFTMQPKVRPWSISMRRMSLIFTDMPAADEPTDTAIHANTTLIT